MLLSLSEDFLHTFKRATEAKWSTRLIDPTLYSFQFQPGTRWNEGLSEYAISEYEDVLGVEFPHDFRSFLRVMNGTDLPMLNTYGSSGEPARRAVGVYSYPGNIDLIRDRLKDVRKRRPEIVADLAVQGFDLPDQANLVPIFAHRYVMCAPSLESSVVLSIFTDLASPDAIVYGNSLREYLEKEFLEGSIGGKDLVLL